MGMVRTTFIIAAIAVTGGCYRWVPTEQATIPPGTHVDVHESYEIMEKVKDLADILIPLHEPGFASGDAIG